MEDTLQPINTDVLVMQDDSKGVAQTAKVQSSTNLIQANKRFSLLAQIYNWQQTGTILRLNLPIENTTNEPIFGLRVSPDWINARFMMRDTTGNRGYRYLNRKCWTVPWNAVGLASDISIGTGITVIENDDIPDIALFNMAAFGWKGGINYQLRCISNVTTQGKLSFSRMYDVFQPVVSYDPTNDRAVFPGLFNSQTHRRKNAFMIGDFSRTSDFELQCPYVSKVPFQVNRDVWDADRDGYLGESSWVFMDVIGALSASAGASTALFEIWIQAAPDFEYVFPGAFPMQLVNHDNYRIGSGTPWIFGQGANTTYIAPDTITGPT